MKDINELKKFLGKIKSQIEEVNYFLDRVSIPGGSDRELQESKKNLHSARTSLKFFEGSIIKELREADQEIRGNVSSNIDNKYKKHLTSINSPNLKMMKNSEQNMTIKKSVFSQNMIKGGPNVGKKV